MQSTNRWKKPATLTLALCAFLAVSAIDLREAGLSVAAAQNNLKPKTVIKPQRPVIKVPKTSPGRFGTAERSAPSKSTEPSAKRSGTVRRQPDLPASGAAVPLPIPRPVLSFGLPAIIDAPTEERTILAVIPEDAVDLAAVIADRFSVDLLDEAPLPLISARALRVAVADGVSRDEVVRAMSIDPDIIAVQPVYLYVLQEESGPSARAETVGLQYSVARLGLPKAHRISTGKQIPVAIIDTAADFQHSEFGETETASINVSGFDPVPGSHGTAIAGILAAGSTLVGVSPDAHILSIQAFAFDEDGKPFSTSFMIAKALDQAASAGARVINMSFAGPRDPVLVRSLDALSLRNTLMIAAAGNNGPKAKPVYPGAHPETIAVTAIDSAGRVFDGANQGDYVEIAAPGVAILAPAPGEKYDMPSGTSMATAHISGVAALLLERQPDLTTAEFRAILMSTAVDIGSEGRDPAYGAGLVDPVKALASIRQAVD
ncbi:MAG: S8 family serine peptidase [Alphaproteobacteria bacterium]|nr:S8 family serine peptidase [Alphaproteobacteria bacterium]